MWQKDDFMKNSLFNFLRFMAETGITAIGVAYLGLALIWNLPFGEQIRDTCIIVSTLLGVFVGISRSNYNNAQFGSIAVVSKEDVTETIDESEYEGTTDED